jgi:hypothetical protein
MQRRKGVVEAAGRGIEEIPGSFGPPLLGSFSRGRRDGYHPAVFDAQEEGGVLEAAGRGIEEIPGSFVPPFWALLVGAEGQLSPGCVRYPTVLYKRCYCKLTTWARHSGMTMALVI